jgi:hypothetical protein
LLEINEFLAAKDLLEKWVGLLKDPWADFRAIDDDGSGSISFDEFQKPCKAGEKGRRVEIVKVLEKLAERFGVVAGQEQRLYGVWAPGVFFCFAKQ